MLQPDCQRTVSIDTAGRVTHREDGGPTGAHWSTLIAPGDRPRFTGLLEQCATGVGTACRGQVRAGREDEPFSWWEVTVASRASEDVVDRYVVHFRDIAIQKECEDQVAAQSRHDLLTGLANRVGAEERVSQALRTSHRTGTSIAILLCDLDRFALVNDSLGNHSGDEVLREVASRLRSIVNARDVLARVGDDEFAIILEHLTEEADALSTAHRIADVMEPFFDIAGRRLHVRASVGIAFGRSAQDGEELIRHAGIAMLRAKENGGATYRIYTPDWHTDGHHRLELEGDLRGAIEAGQLLLHYQPVVELASGRLYGAEALLRWDHPVRGLVSPADFIPIAEQTRLILPIGEWVLREACSQAARFRAEQGARDFVMAVNVSPIQLQDPSLVDVVRGVLRDERLPPQNLTLEITESALAGDTAATQQLTELKALGIGLAIDDFGTGYSSLSYLSTLPIDRLKIDRSFVAAGTPGSRAHSLLLGIVDLGTRMGLDLVAEGIENEQQADLLRRHGCGYGQGFHLGRPVPEREFSLRPRRTAGVAS